MFVFDALLLSLQSRSLFPLPLKKNATCYIRFALSDCFCGALGIQAMTGLCDAITLSSVTLIIFSTSRQTLVCSSIVKDILLFYRAAEVYNLIGQKVQVVNFLAGLV